MDERQAGITLFSIDAHGGQEGKLSITEKRSINNSSLLK